MDDISLKLAEIRLEEIRVYISKAFKSEETRDSALALVVESFYSRHFESIVEANKSVD